MDATNVVKRAAEAFELINVSLVVVAEAHNASLLHHSFLVAEGIVPPEMEPMGSGGFTLPTQARVLYPEGYEFKVQGQRLQLLEGFPTFEGIAESKLPGFAERYLRTLPHVHYRAVGTNISALAEMPAEDAASFLEDRFLAPATRGLLDQPLMDVELKLSYERDFGMASYSMAVGEATTKQETEPKEGIVIQGNYHHSLDTERALEDALEEINAFSSRVADFIGAATRLLDL